MTDIILHHYDASPFSQKAIKMLAIKGLAWTSVLMPMVKPKPELMQLTGGYQGTPVLQLGAHLYADTMGIARALDAAFPEPSLFPNGNRGMPVALNAWGDAFFEAGLHMAIHDLSGDWDAAFMADRKAVFQRLDFDEVKACYSQAAQQFRALAALVDEQLSDGRAFLQGAKPGLADIHAWAVPWFVRAGLPCGAYLLEPFAHMPGWEARMAALGEGRRTDAGYEVAQAAIRSGGYDPALVCDADDPSGLMRGQAVIVSPVGSNRGDAQGYLVALNPREIAIQHEEDALGAITVHFPRWGYAVRARD